MLKKMQQRVNESTKAMEKVREDTGQDLDPIQERLLQRLSLRQGNILELTQKIATDLGAELEKAAEAEDLKPEDADD